MSDQDDWIPMEDGGFVELVGPFYHQPVDSSGVCRFRFHAQDKHRNRNGVVHGGMIATFADRSLGFTARRGETRRQATIQLDIHFIKSVEIGDAVDFEGRIIKETRNFVFADGTMTVGEDVVATARGVWRIWKDA